MELPSKHQESHSTSRPVFFSGPGCDLLPPPGNDLARSYGWGPGFSHRMLKAKFLEKVKKASAVQLDRCVCARCVVLVWCCVWCVL